MHDPRRSVGHPRRGRKSGSSGKPHWTDEAALFAETPEFNVTSRTPTPERRTDFSSVLRLHRPPASSTFPFVTGPSPKTPLDAKSSSFAREVRDSLEPDSISGDVENVNWYGSRPSSCTVSDQKCVVKRGSCSTRAPRDRCHYSNRSTQRTKFYNDSELMSAKAPT